MDDTYLDEVLELTDADFAPAEAAPERLPLLPWKRHTSSTSAQAQAQTSRRSSAMALL
ncbi:hypothetical protein ACRJ4W_08940 [Streptomyces sp. GLT-R25]